MRSIFAHKLKLKALRKNPFDQGTVAKLNRVPVYEVINSMYPGYTIEFYADHGKTRLLDAFIPNEAKAEAYVIDEATKTASILLDANTIHSAEELRDHLPPEGFRMFEAKERPYTGPEEHLVTVRQFRQMFHQNSAYAIQYMDVRTGRKIMFVKDADIVESFNISILPDCQEKVPFLTVFVRRFDP